MRRARSKKTSPGEYFLSYVHGVFSSLKKKTRVKDREKLPKELYHLVHKKEFRVGIATCAIIVFSLSLFYRSITRPDESSVKKIADISEVKKVSPTPSPATVVTPPAPEISESTIPPSQTPQREIASSDSVQQVTPVPQQQLSSEPKEENKKRESRKDEEKKDDEDDEETSHDEDDDDDD